MKTFSLFLTLFLFACAAHTNKPMAPVAAAEEQSNLTRVEAEQRAERISNVRYALAVHLDQTPSYRGEEEISFHLTNAESDLRLDFFHGEIKSLEINGVTAAVNRTPTYVNLQKQRLKPGDNLVKIAFSTEMQTNGTGLHRFEDPVDKAVYLHTQFEAFYANKFMPCFDQPDLKAPLTLKVTAPAKWTVVSTTRETAITNRGEFRTWHFPATPVISTYLYSLHAGPFHVWEDRFEGIPLRLLARPSMAKFVRPNLWFRTTKQGLGFYNKFFGYPYPFQKYDQLLMPEFNAGAMENVGAVTFSERYLKRGRMSREDESDVVEVLLHEMAHMWFGDLVTMRWWNDLWLNESFATYMSSLAADQATPYKESWVLFFRDTKRWAYFQDQLSTTHPIEGDVPDTDTAFASFDGITYGKGASVLKQMNRWLTPKIFQKGIQHYMRAYAYKNTTRDDFIGSLQKFSPRDLVGWSKSWLQQSGLDTVTVSVACQGEKLDRITLESTPSIPGNFRPQSLVLALYGMKNGRLSLAETKSVEIEKEKQSFSFPAACPDLVYPNQGDHGYMKVSFDQKSVASLEKSISSLPDVLSRLMFWSDLWQMTRDQKISLETYAKIAAAHLEKETDEQVLKILLNSISGGDRGGDANVIGYWPAEGGLSVRRQAFIDKMEVVYFKKIQAAPAGQDIQYFWWDSFVHLARSPANQLRLHRALAGKWKVKGIKLDQDRRWKLVGRLCRLGAAECFALVKKENANDPSDRGEKSALSCRAVFPDLASKEKLLQEALRSTELSLQKRRAIANALFPLEQKNFAEKLEKVFFDFFTENKNSSDMEALEAMTGSLSSLNCQGPQSQKLLSFMKENPDFPASILRGFREDLDEDLRCQKIRTKLKSATQAS